MPTDHGFRRLRKTQNRASADACDRTAGPVRSAVGAGLHLLSLAFAGTVDHATLSGMTDDQKTQSAEDPQVRELAEIPAVEVITRSAVMLMSAAAEKLGLKFRLVMNDQQM